MTETELKPFLDDMISMSTGTDGHTLQINFCRPVTKADRQAIADAHNAIVRGQLTPAPQQPGEEMRAELEGLRIAAASIREWMPETLPENEHGQIHFARALAESAAAAIEQLLAATDSTSEGRPSA